MFVCGLFIRFKSLRSSYCISFANRSHLFAMKMCRRTRDKEITVFCVGKCDCVRVNDSHDEVLFVWCTHEAVSRSQSTTTTSVCFTEIPNRRLPFAAAKTALKVIVRVYVPYEWPNSF